MKTYLSSLILAGALGTLPHSTVFAQNTAEPGAAPGAQMEKQEERAKAKAAQERAQKDAAVKAEAAREQAEKAVEAARKQAERARQQAEGARQQAELTAEEREKVREGVEKAHKEMEKARAKVDETVRKMIAKVDLSELEAQIEAAVEAGGANIGRLLAQITPPPPPAAPAIAGLTGTARPVRKPSVFSRGRPAVRPLVVSAAANDPKTLANMEEDLTVMWNILDKELEKEAGKESGDRAMGIWISGGERGPNAMLLEGYGAMFLLNVKFPLVAPPVVKEEKKPEPQADSTWEKTRRELFGSPDSVRSESKFTFLGGKPSPEMEYDAVKVEALKGAVMEALKNASNLRHLKSDDFITVVIQGGGSGDVLLYKSGGGDVKYSTSNSSSSSGSVTINKGVPIEVRTESFVFGGGGDSSSRGSVMAIRVKKSDVDDYAKGKLTADKFRQKATVSIH